MGELDTQSRERGMSPETAAAQGRPDALYDLGLLYSTGSGVDPDYVTAHMWFNLAAMQGVRRAQAERAELAKEMSPAEIAQAQRRAREWLARQG